MSARDHDTGPRGVTVDQLIERIFPVVDALLARLEGDEFTTREFIDLLLTTPEGRAAYDEARRLWGEEERATLMVIHGQVISGALRRSTRVAWSGYAHGSEDEYAVPALWTLTGT